MDPASRPAEPFVAVGSARLPKTVSGDGSRVLMIELTLDAKTGRIVDVATTIPLPGYTACLHSLLIGRRLDEVDGLAWQLCEHVRGPLLKPTIAALANAVLLMNGFSGN